MTKKTILLIVCVLFDLRNKVMLFIGTLASADGRKAANQCANVCLTKVHYTLSGMGKDKGYSGGEHEEVVIYTLSHI